MATTWQFRRGTRAENDAFTGAAGEITVDMETRTIRLHDGVTQGGWRIFTQGNTLSANAIFFDNSDTDFAGTELQTVLEEADDFINDLQTDSHTHTNKSVLDSINDSGSGSIIATSERIALNSAVQDGANVGGGEGQIYQETSTNTISFRTIRAGQNIEVITDNAPNEVEIRATSTIGTDAILIDFDPVGTEYTATNVQVALQETDARLQGVEGVGTVPVGGIMMWSGAIGNIPANWILCDGRAAVNGVVIPDLRDRFIVGAGGSYVVGTQGGEVVNNHTHIISGSTDGHVLTIAEMPAHSHTYTDAGAGPNSGGRQGHAGGDQAFLNANRTSFSTGGNAAHSHNLSLNTGEPSDVENRPPYYALAYIIYVGV